MTEFPLSDWETRRLAALHQLEILDTAPQKDYDHIVALAAQVCNCPIATLGFLDEDRTWFKATIGIDIQETPKIDDYRIGQLQHIKPVIIEDTLADPRSLHHPNVVGAPFVRSLIIFPLITEEGYPVGHLSVADQVTGRLNDRQYKGLEMLAQQTLSLLKLRLQIIRMRRMEDQSRKTLEQISPVFNNAVDAVVVTDARGRIRQWNPRAEEMFGYRAREAVGAKFYELLMTERNQHLFWESMEKLNHMPADANHKQELDFMAVRKNGSRFLVSVGVSKANIEGESVYLGFFSDLTERRQVARELDKQKTFYENILNKIPTDIAVFDADHRYLFVNPWGIKNSELRAYIIGKDDFEYAAYRGFDTSLAIKRRAQFLKAKITGKPVSWEDQGVNPEGKVITHLRRFFPVMDPNGRLSFVIGFGVDITDRKILEEEQNILVERLSFQNSQLIDFCNIVTHNVRGPLNNMGMLVEFAQGADDLEEQNEMISKLGPVINGLKETLDQLVETIQTKQDLEITSEKVDLESSLEKTLQGLSVEVQKTEAVIETDFSVKGIFFPPKYVDSIFHNLVSNAMKYRSPKRQPLIKISTRRRADSVLLSVQDNGLGIDLEKHGDSVFKIGKIFHANKNAKGLGLYMTKTQVETMGGTIWVQSEVDKGTCFTIEFKNQPMYV